MKNLLVLAILALGIVSCKQKNDTQKTDGNMTKKELPDSLKSNPLLHKSTLQYQAPEFDKIKNKDFKPAFDYALKEQMEEIDAIANNTEAPTFNNTLEALELSGENLKRAQSVFYNLLSANTNDTLQKLAEEYAPIFAAQSDKIFLNSNLYNRIQRVYNERNFLSLDPESVRLIEVYKQEFEKAGANLSEDKKEELKKINGQLASLSTQFSNKLLGARKAGGLLISDVKKLDGLSEDQIAAAKEDAKKAGEPGKYLLALQNTTQQPLLKNLKNRDVREELFKASWERASKGDENDTRSTLEAIAKLRLKKAKILGKKNYAAWSIQDQMAKTPEAALKLLSNLAKPSVKKAKQEAVEIQKLIDAQGGNFTLEPWDWDFYAEQVKKQKFDLDESEVKPYFEIRNVLEKGVFYAAKQLYGITFKERTDLPVYHPDVVAYEVFDKDGKSLAIYYLDFYTRDNKNGGAWMSNFVEQSTLLDQKPVIVNVFNFQKPAPGKPSLVSYDDVTTMFHEFGHSIHGFFANQKYEMLSGTNVPRDFVEFPSQINENWALEPSILKNYAIHYETGEAIPQSLVEKLKESKNFNIGYVMTELVAAATLDMAWHTVNEESKFKPADEFENDALEKYGLLVKEVPTRYHSPYFSHIWGGGYAAGYYAYLWTQMLEADAYDWIEKHGGMTPENGDRFRKYILSVGNSEDLNKAFHNFTGYDPTIDPLLKAKGLN